MALGLGLFRALGCRFWEYRLVRQEVELPIFRSSVAARSPS